MSGIFSTRIRFQRAFRRCHNSVCGAISSRDCNFKGGSKSQLAHTATSSGPFRRMTPSRRSLAFGSIKLLRTKRAVQGCQPLKLKLRLARIIQKLPRMIVAPPMSGSLQSITNLQSKSNVNIQGARGTLPPRTVGGLHQRRAHEALCDERILDACQPVKPVY